MRRRTLAGYLRTLNYRRHPVKPDTSLYTDLPSRLRAMALVLEGPKERLQYRSGSGGMWANCGDSGWTGARRIKKVLSDSAWDYRLKPSPPARLYVDITDDGRLAHTYDLPMVPMPGTARVTYVLEHPDAND